MANIGMGQALCAPPGLGVDPFCRESEAVFLQPAEDEVGNLGVVFLLEHKVAVAVDVLVG